MQTNNKDSDNSIPMNGASTEHEHLITEVL